MLRYTVACKRSYKVKTDDVTLCDIMFMLLYVFSKYSKARAPHGSGKREGSSSSSAPGRITRSSHRECHKTFAHSGSA
jgi:hypothetical protein